MIANLVSTCLSRGILNNPCNDSATWRSVRDSGRGFVVLLATFVFVLGAQAESIPQSATPKSAPAGLQESDWTEIQSAHQAARHRIREDFNGGYVAVNPGQRWSTSFDGRGFLVQPDGADWKWGLQLASYGFPGSESPIGDQPEVRSEGQQLEYIWDGGALTEWFINDQRGLEHGFIIARRPEGFDASRNDFLVFNLHTLGRLQASIASDAKGVHFRDGAGAAIVDYSGLKVWDADGKVLRSHFEPAGADRVRLVVDEVAARYPITIDPIAQQAYLKASNTDAGDQFGIAVGISGDTAVVSAPYEDSSTPGVNGTPNEDAEDSGAVYVFVRNASGWSQQAYLKASNPGSRDLFGTSVAISGDTIVVGSPLEDSSTTTVNSIPNEDADGAGAAYVFVGSAGVWTQQAYLKGSYADAGDIFGRSIAVSEDTIIVGAGGDDSSTPGVNSTPNNTPDRHGAAYVFFRSGGNWTQQAYLKSSNPGVRDEFGSSVAISGDTAIVGADSEDSSTTGINGTSNDDAENSGAAYIFVRDAGTWTQQAFLKASNTGERDQFGGAVALSGDTAVIGAKSESSSTTVIDGPTDDAEPDSGAAYVFVRNANTWTQQAFLKPNQNRAFSSFGTSVAISDNTVIVGATGEDSITSGVNSIPDYSGGEGQSSGAAYIFARSAGTWTQQAYLKASNSKRESSFGFAVAVSDGAVIVGARQEDSSTTGVNSIPDQDAIDAGAAYIFTVGTDGQAPRLRVSRDGNETVISYDRPKDPENAPPTVRHSPNSLQNFNILPTTEYDFTLTDIAPGNSETITIRIPDDGSASRFFMIVADP